MPREEDGEQDKDEEGTGLLKADVHESGLLERIASTLVATMPRMRSAPMKALRNVSLPKMLLTATSLRLA